MRAPDANDVLAGVGLVLIGCGLAMWSVPLALVVTGCIVLAIGLYGAVRKGEQR
jgi:hypothetical protein